MKINQFINQQNQIQYSSKLDIISAIYNQWNIKELKSDGICKAWLLNWSPVYWLGQINLVDGTISYKEANYEMKLHGCKIEDINKASKVALSFRQCDELGLSVCLVKFIY